MGPLLIKWNSVQDLICDPDVLPSARLLGVRLYSYQNANTGKCFPSVARLAHDLGYSERTIRKLLRHLEEKGWVKTAISAGPKGTNFYNLPYAGRKWGAKGAELPVPANRNCPPAELGKELGNEKKEQKRRSTFKKNTTGGAQGRSAGYAKKRQELEAAVAARRGDGGWEYVMDLGDYTIDAATKRLFQGDDIERVITAMLNGG